MAATTVPLSARRAFALVALLVAVYAVLDIVVQLLPPHYSAIQDAESDLAVGPYGWIMTINFVVRGALSLLFLWAFYRTVRPEGRGWGEYRGGAVALAIWGVGAILLAIFPTDVPATPISWHGAIHLVVALLAFLGGAIGVYLLSSHFASSPVLRPAQGWATLLALLVIVFVVGELALGVFTPRVSEVAGGLLERLFLGSVLLWILLVALFLAREPGRATA